MRQKERAYLETSVPPAQPDGGERTEEGRAGAQRSTKKSQRFKRSTEEELRSSGGALARSLSISLDKDVKGCELLLRLCVCLELG